MLKMWNEIAKLNVSVRSAQSNSIKMNTDGGRWYRGHKFDVINKMQVPGSHNMDT